MPESLLLQGFKMPETLHAVGEGENISPLIVTGASVSVRAHVRAFMCVCVCLCVYSFGCISNVE